MNTTHSPGQDGIFGNVALCGAAADTSTGGVLIMSVIASDVTCPVCLGMKS